MSWIGVSGFLCLFAVCLGGCESIAVRQAKTEVLATDGSTRQFGVAHVRLDEAFTLAGTEASKQENASILTMQLVVRLTDQFDDPIKAAGQFRFSFFKFRPNTADPRGASLIDPIAVDLTRLEDNQRHWDRILSAYRFLVTLDFPEKSLPERLVCQVTFLTAADEQMQDALTVEIVRKPAARIP